MVAMKKKSGSHPVRAKAPKKTAAKAAKKTRQKTEKKQAAKYPAVRYTYSWVIPHSTVLLDFLLSKIPLSRNSVKKLLHDRKVLVNGKPVTQFDYPLAKDDEVKIAKNPVRMENTVRLGKKKTIESPLIPMFIYEDDQFLAINKPNGLLSVESDKERLCAYSYACDYLRMKGASNRPYILHRIDKETSGVLVFAKDIKVHSMLRMHWNEDITLREYYAVVNGTLEEKKGRLVHYLAENENNIVYITKNKKKGKKAITNYEVVKENEEYSLLKVTIETGRKNQIRVQMASIGHPIVGDDKYGDGKTPFARLGLHASELDFVHPETHETMKMKAPVPDEFYRLFDQKKPALKPEQPVKK